VSNELLRPVRDKANQLAALQGLNSSYRRGLH